MGNIIKEYDSFGNLLYYKDMDTGFWERNTYNENNKLIRQETHYPMGQVEIDHYVYKSEEEV